MVKEEGKGSSQGGCAFLFLALAIGLVIIGIIEVIDLITGFLQ